MDIIKTLGNSRLYTFHSHTQFCDGHAQMIDFARAAVEARFTHYGFSPHSPIPVDSPCNMSKDDVPAYLDEVDRIRGIYGDKLNFYAGMEIDYLGPQWGPAADYFRELPLDFRIGSVHFIPGRDGRIVDIDGSAERFIANMSLHFNNDIRYVVETFFDHSAAMIETGGFDILGHFDKIAQNTSAYMPGIEDSQWYMSLIDDLIAMIIRHRPIVEINTKSKVAHDRIFPSERYIPRLIDAGIDIIVNSDAHYPELINASRQYAFSLLDSANGKN